MEDRSLHTEDMSMDTKNIKVRLALIFISFILVYYNTFNSLIKIWNSNEDYSHGFIILPISLYLIWRNKDSILSLKPSPTFMGYFFLGLWALVYLAGMVGKISTLTNLSMILFPLGAFSFLLGGEAAYLILFPSFFMIFMFPIPSEVYTRITNPLLLISTDLSFRFLSLFEIPIMKEGNLLTLPNYSMEVVNACSGIRSMIAIMAITLLAGYMSISSKILRSIFFLISIPIAMFGNVVRISITALIAYYLSPKLAEGYSHTFAGIVTFILSISILYGCIKVILWYSKKKE